MTNPLRKEIDAQQRREVRSSLQAKGLLPKRRRKPVARDHFPGYPHLKRVCESPRYGRMELIEVSRTSDGFLVGMARFEDGSMHSVFLGAAR